MRVGEGEGMEVEGEGMEVDGSGMDAEGRIVDGVGSGSASITRILHPRN